MEGGRQSGDSNSISDKKDDSVKDEDEKYIYEQEEEEKEHGEDGEEGS